MKRNSNKTPDVALLEVRRLKGKPFYPAAERDEDGKTINFGEKELARTLFSYCDSDTHMKRVIDAAVIRPFGENGQDRCPSPSDLWALCRDVNPTPAVAVVVNPDCPECEGTGYQFVQTRFGISGAARCRFGCAVAGGAARQQQADNTRSLSDWYSREMQEAAARRQNFKPRQGRIAPRVTDAEIDRLRQQQDRNRQAMAS